MPFKHLVLALALTAGGASTGATADELKQPAPPLKVEALSRQLRVDLTWEVARPGVTFEVQRRLEKNGPFETRSNRFPELNFYTDFWGATNLEFWYRVRCVQSNTPAGALKFSEWSEPVKARQRAFDAELLLDEVQEASFRYFYDFAHPVSGLARVSLQKDRDLCEIGGTGWGLFNLAVGAHRGFVTRTQAAERTLKILRFLDRKADSFHGTFPHWINGSTGKTVPFSKLDDGADLVETAFLIEGVLMLREYFAADNPQEQEIRTLANGLWKRVEWDWFASEKNGRACLLWHWSPNYLWEKDHAISGFNECQIAYILALSSPTHPIQPKAYWEGWEVPTYGSTRTNFDVPLQLGRDLGPPLFWTQYSYLGFDPRQISCFGRTYFQHFQDFCRVQIRYAQSRSNEFRGYGPMWGLTASRGPKGYRAFAPGPRDNGTIAPTAALSAMPYVPEESRAFLARLYCERGNDLWGPFGFYDAVNLSLDWIAYDYLGNDLGPIAPMIENYRSGFCWKTFMKAPELDTALKILASPPRTALK